jgi:hypothetical protein
MKQKLVRNLKSIKGSALVAAAVVSTVLAVTVSGFLAYVNHEYYINYRSFHWTQALHLAEAGIEDGFFELNYRHATGSNGFLAGNGWQPIGGSVAALQPLGAGETGYSKTVTNLSDSSGKVVGSYIVQVINPDGENPYILAKGTVANAPYGINVSRMVKAVIETAAMFNFALFSNQQINLNGNNVTTDSYISTDPAYSTNGAYDPAKKRARGDIGTNATVVDAISVGNADVYGYAAVGPGGSVSIQPNGRVGPFGTPNGTMADGYFRNDMAIDLPSASLPADFSTSTATSLGAVTSTTTITSGDYVATGFNMAGQTKVTFSGNVRIYVSGNIATSGQAQFIVAPGSSVKIYVGGSAISISGNGVANNSVTPDKFQLYGLSSVTSTSISGNGAFCGTLYAPQANLSISGNGVLYGAVVANSITMDGNAAFHYDEALKQTGPTAGYRVRSWEEISISQ